MDSTGRWGGLGGELDLGEFPAGSNVRCHVINSALFGCISDREAA